MKLRNYKLTKSIVFGVTLLVFVACSADSNKNAGASTKNNVAQTENQESKTGLDFFDLPDSTIKTTVSKTEKICLPIAKNTNNQSFSVSMTKSPLHGTLNPTISGNILCFEYTPKTGYSGLDQFDCKVCFTSSGFCQERTWHVDVKNTSKNAVSTTDSPPNTSPKAPRTAVKKEEEIVPTPVSSSSSIFDASKKNNDGYVPKN